MQRVKKFTLIELLVVIAIIGILAALLLPALSLAKDVAKQSACINGEKQITLAMLMYADNYDSYTPKCISNTSRNWPAYLDGYLQGNYGGAESLDDFSGDNFNQGNYKPSELWYCPGTTPNPNSDGTYYGADDDCKMVNYGTFGAALEFKTASLKKPTEAMWIVDCCINANSSDLLDRSRGAAAMRYPAHSTEGWEYCAAFRHSNTTIYNMAFFDGHVQSMPRMLSVQFQQTYYPW